MSLMTFLAMSPSPSAGGESAGSGPMMMNLVFIGAMVLIFYMLIWRPQAQRQKKQKAMINELKRGDNIVTTGGLILKVKDVKEDRLVCTTSEGTKIEVARHAVSQVTQE